MERKSTELVLEQPVEAHGGTISKLTISEPSAREFEAMDRGKGEIQKTNHLLAACAKVPYSTILNLSARDYQAALGALGELGFTQASETSSDSEE